MQLVRCTAELGHRRGMQKLPSDDLYSKAALRYRVFGSKREEVYGLGNKNGISLSSETPGPGRWIHSSKAELNFEKLLKSQNYSWVIPTKPKKRMKTYGQIPESVRKP